MSKRLYLIRHAHTPPGTPDLMRNLSARGESQAVLSGRWMKDRGASPNHIVCSPAQRTTQTAHLLLQESGTPKSRMFFDKRLYESTLDHYLEVVHEMDDEHSEVWLVGHNWAISALANYLSGKEDLELPPAAVVALIFDVDSWSRLGPGTLLESDFLMPF